MPGGLSWPKYVTLMSSSMFMMFLGSQLVHNIYKPLKDQEEYVEKFRESYTKELEKKYGKAENGGAKT